MGSLWGVWDSIWSLWGSVGSQWALWGSVELYGVLWDLWVLHGVSMGFYGIHGVSMGSIGLSGFCMGSQWDLWVLWGSVRFGGDLRRFWGRFGGPGPPPRPRRAGLRSVPRSHWSPGGPRAIPLADPGGKEVDGSARLHPMVHRRLCTRWRRARGVLGVAVSRNPFSTAGSGSADYNSRRPPREAEREAA